MFTYLFYIVIKAFSKGAQGEAITKIAVHNIVINIFRQYHYHLLSLESSPMSFLIPIHRQQKAANKKQNETTSTNTTAKKRANFKKLTRPPATRKAGRRRSLIGAN